MSRFVEVRRSRGTAQNRHAASLGQRSRLHLVAEELEDLGTRADERDSVRGASAREARVLAEKAVAGMNRVAARLFGERNNLFSIEVRGRAHAS